MSISTSILYTFLIGSKVNRNQHFLYEPLHYPLFYPYGNAGWHINLILLNPPYKKVSQIEHYRHRILTDTRFGMLGRPLNKNLVGMFSSAEDNRLNWTSSVTTCRVGLWYSKNSMKPSKLRVDAVLGKCTCQHPTWGLRGCSESWSQTVWPSWDDMGRRHTGLRDQELPRSGQPSDQVLPAEFLPASDNQRYLE